VAVPPAPLLINFKVCARDGNLRNSQPFKDENQTELYINVQFVPHSKHTKPRLLKKNSVSVE
jgi:hypothetical protein